MSKAVLQRLVNEREQVNDGIDKILAHAEEEERDPSESERELITRQRSRLEELEPQIGELLDLEEARGRSRDARGILTRPAPSDGPADTPTRAVAGGGEDEPVYRSFAQYARDELIVRFDKIANRAGRGEREAANERLTRAVANTLTADIPGLLPKQHLAQIIDVIDRARPLVGASRQIGLTAGKVTYPKITQRPIVGEQTAEKTELPSQKMTVAMVEAVAKVYGGAGDLSWQDIAWSNPDALGLWFDLAAEAYAHQTDAATAAELATAPAAAIAITTPVDLAKFLGAVADAAAAIYTATRRRPDTLAMSIADGYSLLALVGQTSPVFVSAGGGSLQSGTGNVSGFTLVISPSIAQGTAYVYDSSALLTAETPGAPVELRAVEPSIAGFEVGVVGAFVAELMEPAAVQKLTVAPFREATATSGGRKASS
jgi:HK97 family phage major capsid protein